MLQKYRDRLKQERRRHLKSIEEQANYCIRGGHLHNRLTLKARPVERSYVSCPKMDYDQAHRIIRDIKNQHNSSKEIMD